MQRRAGRRKYHSPAPVACISSWLSFTRPSAPRCDTCTVSIGVRCSTCCHTPSCIVHHNRPHDKASSRDRRLAFRPASGFTSATSSPGPGKLQRQSCAHRRRRQSTHHTTAYQSCPPSHRNSATIFGVPAVRISAAPATIAIVFDAGCRYWPALAALLSRRRYIPGSTVSTMPGCASVAPLAAELVIANVVVHAQPVLRCGDTNCLWLSLSTAIDAAVQQVSGRACPAPAPFSAASCGMFQVVGLWRVYRSCSCAASTIS